jgi:hypothetical protein
MSGKERNESLLGEFYKSPLLTSPFSMGRYIRVVFSSYTQLGQAIDYICNDVVSILLYSGESPGI